MKPGHKKIEFPSFSIGDVAWVYGKAAKSISILIPISIPRKQIPGKRIHWMRISRASDHCNY